MSTQASSQERPGLTIIDGEVPDDTSPEVWRAMHGEFSEETFAQEYAEPLEIGDGHFRLLNRERMASGNRLVVCSSALGVSGQGYMQERMRRYCEAVKSPFLLSTPEGFDRPRSLDELRDLSVREVAISMLESLEDLYETGQVDARRINFYGESRGAAVGLEFCALAPDYDIDVGDAVFVAVPTQKMDVSLRGAAQFARAEMNLLLRDGPRALGRLALGGLMRPGDLVRLLPSLHPHPESWPALTKMALDLGTVRHLEAIEDIPVDTRCTFINFKNDCFSEGQKRFLELTSQNPDMDCTIRQLPGGHISGILDRETERIAIGQLNWSNSEFVNL